MKMERFESVWDALEGDPAEAARLKLLSGLMIEIGEAVKSWNVTNSVAAQKLNVTESRLNQLLKGKINEFDLDEVIELTVKAGLSVHFEVNKAAA